MATPITAGEIRVIDWSMPVEELPTAARSVRIHQSVQHPVGIFWAGPNVSLYVGGPHVL
jgi:hypothetical protein